MKAPQFICLLLCFQHLAFFPIASTANQADNLHKLMKSRKSENAPNPETWPELDFANEEYSPVYVDDQSGLMDADKIDALPGQPEGVDFDQYAGYVTVDPTAGRALFYYFVESSKNSDTNPLVLWLNGGPGCSSLGYGAMEELGPFRVSSDGKTLYRNEYAWNNVANVIFLESPAGVGFSYSNESSDYTKAGDKRTAKDSYIFLMNWLERFPQYKNRDFYITGESYAGHYLPQLAHTILSKNKISNQTVINLKGIAIGNAYIDYSTTYQGTNDYFWTHALISDETHAGIANGGGEIGDINMYNIYAPLCDPSAPKPPSTGSVKDFDPCSDGYVESYLNLPEVQKALHAIDKSWEACSPVQFGWTDSPSTILPMINQLMDNGLRLWVYSGDTDGVIPVTSTRYAINTLKLPVEAAWRPWYSKKEVGGYVVGYKGLVLTTVRGAGHQVPSYQPERALTMISSFLQGTLPPSEKS